MSCGKEVRRVDMLTPCAGVCLGIRGRSQLLSGKDSVDGARLRLSARFLSGFCCDLSSNLHGLSYSYVMFIFESAHFS